MTSRAEKEYRYEKLTWPEINDAIEMGKVCVVPCGAVEQHGPHLPLDVDIICPTEIARGAGKHIPDKSHREQETNLQGRETCRRQGDTQQDTRKTVAKCAQRTGSNNTPPISAHPG